MHLSTVRRVSETEAEEVFDFFVIERVLGDEIFRSGASAVGVLQRNKSVYEMELKKVEEKSRNSRHATVAL